MKPQFREAVATWLSKPFLRAFFVYLGTFTASQHSDVSKRQWDINIHPSNQRPEGRRERIDSSGGYFGTLNLQYIPNPLHMAGACHQHD